MRRQGRWARRQVWEGRWAWLRRNGTALGVFSLFWLVLTVLLVLAQPTDMRVGFAAGAGVASLPWALWTLMNLTDGQFGRARGADAEVDTSSELRRLRSRGWKLVDHVSFDKFDVDHVLVGPAGVFAIETKWTSSKVSVEHDALDRFHAGYARQARASAKKISSLLSSELHRKLDVRPVVVVWRPGRPRLSRPPLIEGDVLLINGPDCHGHFEQLEEQSLDRTDIGDVVHSLESFNRKRDEYDARVSTRSTRQSLGRGVGPRL